MTLVGDIMLGRVIVVLVTVMTHIFSTDRLGLPLSSARILIKYTKLGKIANNRNSNKLHVTLVMVFMNNSRKTNVSIFLYVQV